MPPIGATRYHRLALGLLAALGAGATAACSADGAPLEVLTASTLLEDEEAASPVPATTETATTTSSVDPAPGSTGTSEPATTAAGPAPDWLGRRALPTNADGVVLPQTTPEELRDRRIVTTDQLDPPPDGRFRATIEPLDQATLARSTWEPGCPVEPEELSYLTLSFWGFDGRVHTGEMIVNRAVASDIAGVFDRLFTARFPIEEMRLVTHEDLDAPPTGDGNNTTAFVCRPVTGGTSFSEHAFGLAIDINPFHNPYQRDELVLPELAGHYLDRDLDRPGMVADGDIVVRAFADIGWAWGGDWTTLKDYQHFSSNGR